MIGTGKSLRVLVAPLDWGLGHATRCIPIIGELLYLGCEVVLAADGACAQLLAREFPQLEIKKLPGYHIRYGKKSLIQSVLLQMPGIFKNTHNEHRWLQKLLQKEKFDIIISDNRPGFWNRQSHCIYITHQLRIQSGMNGLFDDMLQRLHYRYIKRFNEVWVPDVDAAVNAAGVLAHPSKTLLHPLYIGPLSRIQPQPTETKKYEWMILLSGPEPQRTLLEQQLIKEIRGLNKKIILVRGLPGNTEAIEADAHVDVFNHLTASQLQQVLNQSEIVICRSGYTTIMDLLKLKKKALLIPTPGQTEQEYLAIHMQVQGCFPFLKQSEFTLGRAAAVVQNFHFQFPFGDEQFEQYRDAVASLTAIPHKL
ncbi:MAG: glycosyltransferase [Chitinophagaceae bacterium]|jgi:uncharacterized protein (TIGR00661 family)